MSQHQPDFVRSVVQGMHTWLVSVQNHQKTRGVNAHGHMHCDLVSASDDPRLMDKRLHSNDVSQIYRYEDL